MMSWLLLLLSACVLLAFADLCVHLMYAVAALHRFETLPTFRVLPPPHNAPIPVPIEIPTTNQLMLRGGIYVPEDESLRGVILFCPETGGGYDTAMNYTAGLLKAGFAVVSFSFRNQAPSDTLPGYRSNYWLTRYEVEDIHAVLDFINQESRFQNLPVGLMGVSRGAGAALAAGAVRPDVARIWTQGGFSTATLSVHHAMKFLQAMVGRMSWLIPEWHVRVTIWFMLKLCQYRNQCRLITLESVLPYWHDREVMFVSGARDTYVPTCISNQLCRLTGHSLETSQWVVPQAKHNLERATAPREFDDRLVSFFSGMSATEGVVRRRQSALAR